MPTTEIANSHSKISQECGRLLRNCASRFTLPSPQHGTLLIFSVYFLRELWIQVLDPHLNISAEDFLKVPSGTSLGRGLVDSAPRVQIRSKIESSPPTRALPQPQIYRKQSLVPRRERTVLVGVSTAHIGVLPRERRQAVQTHLQCGRGVLRQIS